MQNLPPRSVTVVLGTRPEIVKLAHLIRELGPAASVVHTGQHYDPGLSQSFFTVFGLSEPDAFLEVGGMTRGGQIGSAVSALDDYLGEHRPKAVVVQGDTNSALAGAIAANARELPLFHVEAGLRSHDRRMPGEHNRVLIDHLGDLLFAPTRMAEKNLIEEGIPDPRIRVTGNTVVEAVVSLLPDESERARLLSQFGLTPGGYILSTFHRPENVDDPDRFGLVLRELASLDFPVILALHPRARRMAVEHGLTSLFESIEVVDPIGYRDFLGLGAESAFLISDSGGVQEEVSVLKRPVIVVRRSTERPEVLGTFAELVEPGPEISTIARRWLSDVSQLHSKLANEASPYGDGSASTQIELEIEAFVGDT
jgi:UDP-N-acetylglucosamine 2-epimerase (non-hydrolysing)